MKALLLLVIAIALPFSTFAGPQNGAVAWTGRLFDSPSTHNTTHGHYLMFEDSASKKVYDIVDSPELEKLHHETNRNYQIKIEGRITPKFLFFGGNLVVSKYEILGESEEIPLNPAPAPTREFRGSNKP